MVPKKGQSIVEVVENEENYQKEDRKNQLNKVRIQKITQFKDHI